MRLLTLLAVCIAAVAATASDSQRIVGGTATIINHWPYQAAVLSNNVGNSLYLICGGTIINNRSVMSSANCVSRRTSVLPASILRLRLGSTMFNRGGTLLNVAENIIHENYNVLTLDSDIMIIRPSTNIVYTNAIRRAFIASPTYNLPDNESLWVAGWGAQRFAGPPMEQLRQVQVFKINHNVCNQRYGGVITDNMFCSGLLDVGGRGICAGDFGGPVVHNRVVVGISSSSHMCGSLGDPDVNVRVSNFSLWIQENA